MNALFERDLRRMKRRIRLLLVEKHALIVGTGLACAAIVLLALSKWNYSLGEPILLWGVVLAGLLGGAVWGMLRRLTPFAAARAAEIRLDLKERLSSAVSLSPSEDEVVRALVDDAAEHVRGVRPKDVFPHRFNREIGAFGIALLLLTGLFYVPQIPGLQSKTRRQEVRVMKQQGRQFSKLAKEALKRVTPENKEIMKRIALNMQRLGKKLESGRLTRKQAMLAVNKLSKEVKAAQDRIAAASASKKSLAKAGEELSAAAPDLARKMLEQIEKQRKTDAATGKTNPKLEQLAKRLKDIQASSGPMSEAEMQKIEEELAKYVSSTEPGVIIPPELAKLMSELLKNEDYKKAMELLSQLEKKVGSGKMSKMDQKQLEQLLKAMAKALEGTDLNELAKRMRLIAEALAELDPKTAAQLLAQLKKMQLTPMDMAMLQKMGGG